MIAGGTTSSPVLTFDAYDSNKTPVSCKVLLTVQNAMNSSSCLADVSVGGCQFDCDGVLNGNSKFDLCGVCKGDNSSCVDCKSIDIKEKQLLLDSNALAMKQLVQRAAKALLKYGKGSSSVKAVAKKATAAANKLYISSWTLAWTSIPQLILDCNQTICQTVSNLGAINSYGSNVRSFKRELTKVTKKMSSLGRKSIGTGYLRKFAKLEAAAKKTSSEIPTTTSSCPK